MKQGSTTIAFSYLVEKIDFVIPWPQNRVYKFSAQVTRLTTLCIEFSIKIPTMRYIATLVPLGVQRILFLPGSSKGLKSNVSCQYKDEPLHENTNNLQRRKQSCSNCTADQRLCVRHTDSTITLLLKSEISGF